MVVKSGCNRYLRRGPRNLLEKARLLPVRYFPVAPNSGQKSSLTRVGGTGRLTYRTRVNEMIYTGG